MAAEVTLQFTQEMFEVQENNVAGLVCVEIASGTIVRNIPFSVQSVLSESTTAEGRFVFVWICKLPLSHYIIAAVGDFVAVSEDQQFTILTQTDDICVTFSPNDDTTLEEDETFLVTIVANPPVSTSSPRLIASAVIQNDDSK